MHRQQCHCSRCALRRTRASVSGGDFPNPDISHHQTDRKSTRLKSSHLGNSYAVFFLNDTATTEIYTLSLHDALPIYCSRCALRRTRASVSGGHFPNPDISHHQTPREGTRPTSAHLRLDRKKTTL